MGFYTQKATNRPVIIVEETKVAGLFHNPDAKRIASSLNEGERLLLERDYRNPYDRWAMMVKCPDGDVLGYVSCDVAEVVGRLSEGGRSLHGEVREAQLLRQGARVSMAVILDD